MAASEFVGAVSGSVQSDGVSSVSTAPGDTGVAVVNVDTGNTAEMVVGTVATLELGFSAVVLGIGLIAGFLLSKIVNWWKW